MARLVAERADVIAMLAEIFRTYGFEGTSLGRITECTGLGKGSLYHFFPGGKEEMAAAVLAEIDDWFRRNVFEPLRRSDDPATGIALMFREVRSYFAEGRKVCLVGLFALGNERDRFSQQVNGYFGEWASALREALIRTGLAADAATELAEEILVVIQGGLVLSRAWNEPQAFIRALDRLERKVPAAGA